MPTGRGRPLDARWQDLPPLTHELYLLAHDDDGIHSDTLSQCETLLRHPAVLISWPDHPRRPAAAVSRLVNTVMPEIFGRLNLTPKQFDAARVLLKAVNSVQVQGGRRTDREGLKPRFVPAGHAGRAAMAAELLGRSGKKFRERSQDRNGAPSSPESRLLQQFADAIDMCEALPSVTAHLGWSDRGRLATGRLGMSLQSGTWWGFTDTNWHLKSTGQARSGSFPCAMTVEADGGDLHVNWYYPAGKVYGVSVTLTTDEATGRARLVVVYESGTLPRSGELTHRGAAVLDFTSDDAGQTSTSVAGPYWTDRGRTGPSGLTGTTSASSPATRRRIRCSPAHPESSSSRPSAAARSRHQRPGRTLTPPADAAGSNWEAASGPEGKRADC